MNRPKCYVVGGGLASLASAAYLVHDGGVPGPNVTILEENGTMGGSLDAQAIAEGGGYAMRGYRMLEGKVYSCLFDLLSFVPSLDDPRRTVLEEFVEFNERVKIRATSRLLANGRVVSPFPFDLAWRDRWRVLWFLARPERALGELRIEDYFSPSFFQSNFWIQLCTTFSFQPWHSLAEFRRYILRFYHVSPLLSTMECVQLTPYNEYESIVLPLTRWLEQKGVRFVPNVRVVDFDLASRDDAKVVAGIECLVDGTARRIAMGDGDLVFATLGSMTSGSTVGGMHEPPSAGTPEQDSSWLLWERLAARDSAFGNPAAFRGDTDRSKWVSFTVTLRDAVFLRLLADLTGREIGTEGVVTIKDSNWLLSFAMTPHPFFRDQPPGVSVCWGYGLFPDRRGNHVRKRMSECTGREILVELCCHLGFHGELDRVVETSTCIPCLIPYVTSQFLPRPRGSRPSVTPEGIANVGLLGQYCELAEDIVFTLEYSVRTAQTAVFSRLGLSRKVSPVYRGYWNPLCIYRAFRTVLRTGGRSPAPARQAVARTPLLADAEGDER